MSLSVRVGQTLPSTENTEGELGSVYIPELSVDKLTSGTINAATIEIGDDGRLVVGTTTRIELNQMGLYASKDGAQVFKLDKDGLEITGKVNSIDGTFSGSLVGSTITGGVLSGASIQGGTISIGNGNSVFLASGLGISVGNGTFLGSPFRVSADGTLVATNATIQGTVTGSSIIGSTITAGENGAFTVDALGQLTSKAATISGVIQSATSGPRVVLTHNAALAGGVGQLAFYTGVTGETASGVYATNQAGAGYKKVFSFTTGVDGASGYVGPSMVMAVADAPAGGQWAMTQFTGDQTYFTGTVTVQGNVKQVLPWTNTTVYKGFASDYGAVKYWKDVHNVVHIQGLAQIGSSAVAASTVIATMPEGYRPAIRQENHVIANDTLIRRVDIMTNGQLTVVGTSHEANAYVKFTIEYATDNN